MLGAIIFERIPERMLGRVTAPLDALAWAGMPFGGLVAAALVATAGLGPALLVSAGLYLARDPGAGHRQPGILRPADRRRSHRAGLAGIPFHTR